MAPMTRTVPLLAALLATASLAGCTLLGDPEKGDRDPAAGDARWDASVSMTPAGAELAEAAGLAEDAPTYAVEARVRPRAGNVSGTARLSVPVGDADELLLRWFPGIPDFRAEARIGDVEVDGEPADATVDAALVTVPLPTGHGERVDVKVPFSYTLPVTEGGGGLLDMLGGMGGPADVGLLSRTGEAWNLGHWFPLWIPDGGSAEPDPGGVGDIGNSPAALIRMELSVPDGWTVVDGGVRTGEETTGGTTTVTSEGFGINDLAVNLLRGYDVEERTLGGDLDGVTVRVHGPPDARTELAGVLDEAATSLEVLSDHFVAYPWREFEVVSAPLGSGVGGMEWPGATWIEPSLFAGGVPGLGDLEDLLGGLGGLEGLGGMAGLEDLLGDGGSGGLGGLGGLDGRGGLGGLGGTVGGDTGRMLETMRAWTIAHEVGHEWWHVIVGNDSVLAPVVDEPLAQYSACLVLRELRDAPPGEVDALCDAHIGSGYEQMRLLGDRDGRADRATTDFDSAFQYAGLVYGKAAAFYRALEERYGNDEVATALGSVTEEHAFEMLTSAQLRDALGAALDEPAFDRLWRRWMQGSRGDRDLDVELGSGGGLGGLEGLDGLAGGDAGDQGDLDALLEQLLAQLGQVDRQGGGT
jgi:hypothetical protein